MIKRIFAAATLAGFVLSMAATLQAESTYSPIATGGPPIRPAATSSTFFTAPGPADWNTSGNWSNGVPTAGANAYIGGTGGYTATLAAGGSAAGLFLGIDSTLNPPGGSIGNGTLNLTTGASLNVPGNTYVGYENNGALTLTGSASLNTNWFYVGGAAGSSYTAAAGSVSLSGPGAGLSCGGMAYLGYYAPGTLSVGGGASAVFKGTVYLGGVNLGNDAAGSLLVTGSGSTVSCGGTVYMGGNSAAMSTMSITSGGSFSDATGYIGSFSGSGTATVTVEGSGSTWNNTTALEVGNGTANAALYLRGGAQVLAPAVTVQTDTLTTASLLSIDVGSGSQLVVGGGTGTLTIQNTGAVQVVAGAGPTAGKVYTPISAGGWLLTAPTYQFLGGAWNSATNQFTVSHAVTGTLGSPTSFDTSVNQRVKWTDSRGNMLGASFMEATSSNQISATVTAAGGGTAPPALAYNQFVLGDWALSGPAASTANPIYLSLSANNPVFNNDTLWCYNPVGGTGWTQITPAGSVMGTVAADLSFDGAFYNFTLTGSSGNGLDFAGCDYAVVGTPTLVGDVNLDGRVDINDLTIVLANFGFTGKSWTQGSIDGDPRGTVDINDLTIVLSNFGATAAASGGIGIGAVPEPASLLLLAAALAGLLGLYRLSNSTRAR